MPHLTLAGKPYPHLYNENQVLFPICCGTTDKPTDHLDQPINVETIGAFEKHLQETVIMKVQLKLAITDLSFRLHNAVELLEGSNIPALIISMRNGQPVKKSDYNKLQSCLAEAVAECNKQSENSAVASSSSAPASPAAKQSVAKNKSSLYAEANSTPMPQAMTTRSSARRK